ncbi:hypothetical protein [Algihabitans albus]|uniref:hypothetical protein n=1 Tax=Algihabitans albus TaxID=2164067 RepID=UPI000E5CCF3C|nr:hypothetical protein [Algihabitans albus]
MTDAPKTNTKPDVREARRAEALRANLRRRKQQARERQDTQSRTTQPGIGSEASGEKDRPCGSGEA